jgi:hypothetical protein
MASGCLLLNNPLKKALPFFQGLKGRIGFQGVSGFFGLLSPSEVAALPRA